jgi:hypothetical protein
VGFGVEHCEVHQPGAWGRPECLNIVEQGERTSSQHTKGGDVNAEDRRERKM